MSSEPKDPVCGMRVNVATAIRREYGARTLYFCSPFCERSFGDNPEKYLGTAKFSLTGDDYSTRRIAYFSMEVAVDRRMPNYAGGLGVLAGDTLRTFADLKIPAVATTLLSSKGYLDQSLDSSGTQRESEVSWDPTKVLTRLPYRVDVQIEGRRVVLQGWHYDVRGESGYSVPLILLDSNLPENAPQDRELTSFLYGGDERYRLAQEVLLGIGGVRMLRAVGFVDLDRFHMNEGHSSLLVLELLREAHYRRPETWDYEGVRRRCIFTTHTPVSAGHDQFRYDLVERVLGDVVPNDMLRMLAGNDRLNLTLLALNMSDRINGVAKKHGVVTREMFPGYPIHSITNGVHSATWTCPSFQRLFDRHIPDWRRDPTSLRHAIRIPTEEIGQAHVEAKRDLLAQVERRSSVRLDPKALTIGFARRATEYKRADLAFSDPDRLAHVVDRAGPLQFVVAGKAHPQDARGKEMIRKVFQAALRLKGKVPVVYLENYDTDLAQLLTSGSDLWLNTPLPPLEASGTSGMKAAHNGIPSFSVLDGWWLEGHSEGITGWSIGPAQELGDLYDKLTNVIAPMFYEDQSEWMRVMRNVIAFNASYFNTHRMVQQYAATSYL